MDYQISRRRMVAEQLQVKGIRDERVLKAMGEVPRHLFVDKALWAKAYSDFPLPVGSGQTISQPYMVAIMSELLKLKGTERVLEIGTGSGYQAAILAELAHQVFTVERMPELARKARSVLDKIGLSNVAIRIADGTLGWKEFQPYDRIIVTAAAPEVPDTLVDQLADGGRMLIPVGGQASQVLTVIDKREDGTEISQDCACVFVPLIGKEGWSY
ncbi:protein-L-isoaspartate(D-aspartate) O-methyltransferase [candidate division KSB1 bacterium]